MATTALRIPYTVTGNLRMHAVPMTCETASVAEGSVLVAGSADDKVALPAAAGATGVLGLAMRDGSSATNVPIDVIVEGVFPAVANGTITRGQQVVVASNTGDVKALAASDPPNAQVVGTALESATNGQRVTIVVQPQNAGNGVVVPMVVDTGVTLAAGNVVVVGAADNTVKLPSGADPTAGVLGVALGAGTAGTTVNVLVCGVTTVKASAATITRGDSLAVAASTGTVKTAAPGAGTNSMCVGVALQSFSSSGTGLALIMPFVLQG
jgi:hypothetical protein